jgi:cbb3-type cytochrome oxidase maturation protein
MKIIFLLIIISLIIALGFLGAFIWAVKDGQYDDDVSPAVRMLFDEETKQIKNNHQTSKKS